MFGNRTAGEEFVKQNSANTSSINGPYLRGVRIADAFDTMNDNESLDRLREGIESLIVSIESDIASRQKLGDSKGATIDFKRLGDIEKATKVLDDESKETVDKAKALNKLFNSLFDNIEDMDQQTRKIVSGLAKSNDRMIDAAQTLNDEVGKKTASLGQTLSKSFSTFTNEMQNFVNTMNIKKLAFGNISSVTDFRDMQTTVQQSLQVNREGYRQVQTAILSQNSELSSLGISMKDSMSYMSKISEYQFASNRQASELYKQVSMGTKYLGLSNQNMAAMVKAQNAMADNSYMERQMALLEALGNDDNMIEDISSLAQWTSDNITSIAARSNDPNKFIGDVTAYQTVADAYLGPEAKLLNNMATQLGGSTFVSELSEDVVAVLNQAGILGDVQQQMLSKSVDMNMVYSRVLNSLSEESTQMALAGQGFESWKTLGSTYGRQSPELTKKIQEQYKIIGNKDLTTKEGRDKITKETAQRRDTRNWWEKMWDKLMGNFDTLPDGVTLSNVQQTVLGIHATLKTIAALQIAEAGSSLMQLFGKGGKGLSNLLGGGSSGGILSRLFSSGTGSAAAGGLKAWLGSSSLGGSLTGGAAMSNGAALGVMGATGALALGMGFAQANKTKDWKGGRARGFFLGTANKDQSDGEMLKSIGGNTLKYAAAGAAIGTIVPGLGTAVGGLIGAGVGLITGGIGGLIDKQKDATNENTEAIKRNTSSNNKLATVSDSTVTNSAFSSYYRAMVRDRDNQGGPDRPGAQVVYGESGAKTGQGGYPWTLTSDYGPRVDPVTGEKGTFHHGIDLAAAQGTKIGSATDGKVKAVGYSSGAGNYTVIQGDSDGKMYNYFHQVQKSPLSMNQRVKAGQLVGWIGSTGKSTGPHLHFEVDKSLWGTSVNPKPYVTSSIFKASGAKWDGKYSGAGWKSGSNNSSNKGALSMMEALVDDQSNVVEAAGSSRYISKEAAFSTGVKGQGGVDTPLTPNYATSDDVKELIQVIKDLNEAQNDQKSLLQALSGKNAFVFK